MEGKKTIRVYTNLVLEGWSPLDLNSGIGGSEEKLIEWVRELSSEYDITVYHNGIHGNVFGAKFVDFSEFKPWEHSDIFVSFKNRQILLQSINADKIYHWTSDIEDWTGLDLPELDRIFVISDWHLSRMTLSTNKAERLYLWADFARLQKNVTDKEKDTMLYCSSYDRGLEDLLNNWDKVKKELGIKKLYVTYGWNFIDHIIKFDQNRILWKQRMQQLLKQDGIKELGQISNDKMCKMFWKSEYWCLPCNAPDNELFCINAVKAQYCNCKPVVRRIGGLQETVNEFYDFDTLIGQKVGKHTYTVGSIHRNKAYVEKNFDMIKQIAKWKKYL